MKEYDVILIGTGSGMNIIGALQEQNPDWKMAIIDKDEPGGICLTRGCIPSKILLYPAELVRQAQSMGQFGIEVELRRVDFEKVMDRMRAMIGADIEQVRHGLTFAPNVAYYPVPAEFIGPYTLKAGSETIHSKTILLCTGSRPLVPQIKGLEKAGYLTSDTVLRLRKLPSSIGIIGGGYIAAEYGHFFSSMGSRVTIIGRNPRMLPDEEPEISELAARRLSMHMTVMTDTAVTEVGTTFTGHRTIIGAKRSTGEKVSVTVDEVLVAAGRAPNNDILHPEKAGVRVDQNGWIAVNEYLETSQPGIWAFGDATGRYLFKHVANFESQVVYYNAFANKRTTMDYHAIPHAVFSDPEIASVGMGEKEAVEKYGKEEVLMGLARYEDTAKGSAMGLREYFVKIIARRQDERLLGAHIIGPQASVLVQELVTLMYSAEGSVSPVRRGMHIHPALGEVVERAASSLMPVDLYHHMRQHEREHQHQ